jgi:ribosome-associated heat shock protein Hsp15
MDNDQLIVRIDKWLWAARFFKTRALAKAAIAGGKVHCQGQRVKSSKQVVPGMCLIIRQGYDEKEVIVTALAEQRRSATEATLLYQETPVSVAQRQERALARKAAAASQLKPAQRPNKKQRRQIHRFQRQTLGDNDLINPDK